MSLSQVQTAFNKLQNHWLPSSESKALHSSTTLPPQGSQSPVSLHHYPRPWSRIHPAECLPNSNCLYKFWVDTSLFTTPSSFQHITFIQSLERELYLYLVTEWQEANKRKCWCSERSEQNNTQAAAKWDERLMWMHVYEGENCYSLGMALRDHTESRSVGVSYNCVS